MSVKDIFTELMAMNRVPKFRPRSCRRECFRLLVNIEVTSRKGIHHPSSKPAALRYLSSKANNTARILYSTWSNDAGDAFLLKHLWILTNLLVRIVRIVGIVGKSIIIINHDLMVVKVPYPCNSY